jgi:outer membrane protein OmpA-like peptidoglycan-associated protein
MVKRPLYIVRCAFGGAALFVIACASSPPPRELVDARAVYARTATGDATRVMPAAVNEARIALAAAEEAYNNGEDAYLVRDRAYISMRASELAQVRAKTERVREEHAAAPGAAADIRERVTEAERREMPPPRSNELGTIVDRAPAATGPFFVKDERRGTVITVPAPVLFVADRADFLPGAEDRLEPLAETLSNEGDRQIVVESKADSLGTPVDTGLSLRRADRVHAFLVSHGVPAQRCSVAAPDDISNQDATQKSKAASERTIIVSLRIPSAA